MNVFQMYVGNGNRAGFWVRRDSWHITCAKIISVQGKTEGPLEGDPPYFGTLNAAGKKRNPRVIADIYYRSGMVREELLCPGTYAYSVIDEPDVSQFPWDPK